MGWVKEWVGYVYFGTLAVVGKISLPFNALELKEKVKDEHGMHEVDEGVSNIALSLYEYY